LHLQDIQILHIGVIGCLFLVKSNSDNLIKAFWMQHSSKALANVDMDRFKKLEVPHEGCVPWIGPFIVEETDTIKNFLALML